MVVNKSSSKEVVKSLQLDLELLGFSVGRTGADGFYGTNTKRGVFDFCDKFGISHDLIVGEDIPQSIVDQIHAKAEEKRHPKVVVEKPKNFYDFSAVAWPGPRKYKRDWKDIDTIIIHQTGCVMPADKPKRWYYFESVNSEGVKTVDSLHCQTAVTSKGDIYIIHDPEWMVWHSNGTSQRSIGIEISGLFNGIESEPKTFPGPKGGKQSVLSPEQIEASKELVRYLVKLVASHGGKITKIYPHRISSENRVPDPGSAIMLNIFEPIAKELGLDYGAPGYKVGSGRPIPGVWLTDPKFKDIKY